MCCSSIFSWLTFDIFTRILLPVIIFLSGLFASFIVKQWQLGKKLESNQRFIFFWIDGLRKDVILQVDEIKRIASLYRNPDILFTEVNKHNFHTDKLKAVPAVEMVQTFYTNKIGDEKTKSKLLFQFSNDLDYLSEIQNQYDTYITGAVDFLTENSKEWSSSLALFNEWLIDSSDEDGKDEFHTDVFNVKKDYNEYIIKNRILTVSIEVITKEFIDKLLPIIGTHSEKDLSNPKIIKLFKLCQKLRYLYDRRIINMGNHSNILEKTGDDILRVYTRLVETKEQLQKIKFKPFLFMD